MKTALELAAEDLVANERARRSSGGRAREFLAVLDQVRRRPHGGVAGLVFFELDELPDVDARSTSSEDQDDAA